MSNTNILTKSQEKKADAYAVEMLKNGIKQGIKTDMEFAKTAINMFYKKYLEINEPKEIRLVPSVEAAIQEVYKSTKLDRKDLVKEIVFLNWYSWWSSYYHAGIHILKETEGVEKELIDNLNEYENITHNLHAILPCENICFVIEYPKTVAIKDGDLDKFQLHRENGFALEYSDGTGFAWLNGVEVPDYLAITPAKDLDTKKVMAETNVDVRREGLRRIPMAKFLKEAGATLVDKLKNTKKAKYLDYKLYSADFKDGKTRKLLKMFDVASGTYTIERVEDTCETVKSALEFRDGETDYIYPETRT